MKWETVIGRPLHNIWFCSSYQWQVVRVCVQNICLIKLCSLSKKNNLKDYTGIPAKSLSLVRKNAFFGIEMDVGNMINHHQPIDTRRSGLLVPEEEEAASAVSSASEETPEEIEEIDPATPARQHSVVHVDRPQTCHI